MTGEIRAWLGVAVTAVGLAGAILKFTMTTEIAYVRVPDDLVGVRPAQAQERLQAAGLERGAIRHLSVLPPDAEPNRVVRTDPPGQSAVIEGTAVDLFVTPGREDSGDAREFVGSQTP